MKVKIAVGILASLALCQAVNGSALVARWSFDGSATLIEENALGSGPALEYYGGKDTFQNWRPVGRGPAGWIGRCIDLDGGGLKGTAGFPAGPEFALSFWIRIDDVPKQGIVFSCGDQLSLRIKSDGAKFLLASGGKNGECPLFSTGKWHAIALTASGSQTRLFLDGKQVMQLDAMPDAAIKGSPFAFGKGLKGNFLDEIRVYSGALSEAEIQTLANAKTSMEQIPPMIERGPHRTLFQPEKETLLKAGVSGPGAIELNWSVEAAPAGAKPVIQNPKAAETTVTLTTAGDYRFKLTARNAFGTSETVLRTVVFPPQVTKQGKLFQNPNQPDSWGTALPASFPNKRKELMEQPPYTKAFKEKWFPTIELKQHTEGLAKERFTPPPPPYVHPRVFFGPEELNDIRRRAYDTVIGRETYMLLRAKMYANETDFTDPKTGLYRVYWDKSEKEPIDGKYKSFFLSNQYAVGAFLALLDADTQQARKIIESSMRTCDNQLRDMALVPKDDQANWQDHHNWIVGRYTCAYIYDFLYPWMTEAERAKHRLVLATATQGKWSLGLFSAGASQAGNWLTWFTGELVQNVLAIEGEDGYDPVVAYEAARAMKTYATVGTLPDGSPGDCMAKHSITPQNYLALAKRGYNWISSEGMYNHIASYLLYAMQPYGEQTILDGLLGTSRRQALAGDVQTMKFVYPKDPLVDFIYRNTRGKLTSPEYTRSPESQRPDDIKSTVYGYVNDLFQIVFAEDLSATNSWEAQLAQVTADKPLTHFYNLIGQMMTRSEWDRNAAYLYFSARVMGSHKRPDHGGFVFSALGRDWNYRPQRGPSHWYNLVVIDGKSQEDEKMAKNSKVIDFKDTPVATYAAADLYFPYAHAYQADRSLNDFRLKPDHTYPWDNLPLKDLPNWFLMDRPGMQVSKKIVDKQKTDFIPVKNALRSVTLVRGKQPYLLVVDDFAMKDGRDHDYAWCWTLPPDLETGKTTEMKPNAAIITDPGTGTRCHIEMVRSTIPCTPTIQTEYHEKQKGEIVSARISFNVKTPQPGFIALVHASPKDANSLQWKWEGQTLCVQTPDGSDRITFKTEASGQRVPRLERNGKTVF